MVVKFATKAMLCKRQDRILARLALSIVSFYYVCEKSFRNILTT
jgi:hypothetical protein